MDDAYVILVDKSDNQFGVMEKMEAHGLLLVAGVLLVSIKLIMMAYRNSINYEDVKKELNEIKQLIRNNYYLGFIII